MKNRRRRYFVREGDHWGLLIGAVIMILVLVVVSSGLFYLLANKNLEDATYKAHFDALRNTMQMLLPWLILVNLIGLAVVIALAVILTHKISGPAYHLIQDLRRLGSGDLTVRTRFRRKDRLRAVAAATSDAAAGLHEVVADAKKKLADLLQAADEHPEIKGKAVEIERTLDRLKT